MEHQIKILAESTDNTKLSRMIMTNVKVLRMQDQHLTIYVDNQGAVSELNDKTMEKPLEAALEKVYGDVSYEIKIYK